MATLKKYRKAPKGSKLSSLNDYKVHIKEIDKHNATVLAERKAIKKAKEDIKKLKSAKKKK